MIRGVLKPKTIRDGVIVMGKNAAESQQPRGDRKTDFNQGSGKKNLRVSPKRIEKEKRADMERVKRERGRRTVRGSGAAKFCEKKKLCLPNPEVRTWRFKTENGE